MADVDCWLLITLRLTTAAQWLLSGERQCLEYGLMSTSTHTAVGHFRYASFQSITCTGTDNLTRINRQNMTEKHEIMYHNVSGPSEQHKTFFFK